MTEASKLANELFAKMFAAESLAAVPEETKSKALKSISSSYNEVTGTQFVIGGPVEGSGVFGAACVLKCKDSDVVKGMLSDSADVSLSMIKSLVGPQEPDVQGLSIAYVKGVETLDGMSVDTIDVTHPKIAEMSEGDRAEMQKAMGETVLRIRVAAIDKETVVVSFGGGQPFFAEAVRAAKSGGTIAQAPDVAAAMKHMPADTMELILLSPGNLLDVVVKAATVMAPEGSFPPLQFQSKAPIAIGYALGGSDMRVTVYIPTAVVKDAVGLAQMFMMGGMGPGGQPPPPMEGGEDF